MFAVGASVAAIFTFGTVLYAAIEGTWSWPAFQSVLLMWILVVALLKQGDVHSE